MFIKKILLILLLILVTLPAIAKNTILVIGDSLSAAYGMRPEQGWVALLQQRLMQNHSSYQVVNASITGDTTSNGLARMPAALATNHPVITIIELGANDGLRGLPLSVIQKNLNAMISLAQRANSKVLLLGVRLPPNYGPDYTSGFQKIYPDLAKQNSISVVPLMLANVDASKALFQSDGLHPNATAQPMIMGNIWPVLQDLL